MKTKTRDIWKRWLLLFGLGLCYILVLILLAAVESGSPEGKIRSFGDAFWYSIVTLSTVGYGDLYPVTTIGRIVTMISSVFGIAIIALPSGVITAGYLSEINKQIATTIDERIYTNQVLINSISTMMNEQNFESKEIAENLTYEQLAEYSYAFSHNSYAFLISSDCV